MLTMGVCSGFITQEPILTLTGSGEQEIHLKAAEILRLLDDFSVKGSEHVHQKPNFKPPWLVTGHLSGDHNIIFGWFNKQPVVIIAKRPKDEPFNKSQVQMEPFIKRKKPLRVTEVILTKTSWENLINVTMMMRMDVCLYHRYSQRVPLWLRELAWGYVEERRCFQIHEWNDKRYKPPKIDFNIVSSYQGVSVDVT